MYPRIRSGNASDEVLWLFGRKYREGQRKIDRHHFPAFAWMIHELAELFPLCIALIPVTFAQDSTIESLRCLVGTLSLRLKTRVQSHTPSLGTV